MLAEPALAFVEGVVDGDDDADVADDPDEDDDPDADADDFAELPPEVPTTPPWTACGDSLLDAAAAFDL